MKNKTLLVILITLISFSSFAADPSAGKTKSGSCAACHGASGISVTPNFPNLACQKETYLAKQLRDFKAGTRKDPMMENLAKVLSEADIHNLAAYYASLPCSG